VTAPLGKVDVEALPWSPWTPEEAAARLDPDVRWAVAGGWAVDLFLGRVTRDHEDLEVVVPSAEAKVAMQAFAPPGWDWRVPSPEEMFAPDADALSRSHQTWLWDETRAAFVVDVFRDLVDGDRWICRRDETIRRPYAELIHHTADGIPYQAPELVLLFKAKHNQAKDEADLVAMLPWFDAAGRHRCADLIRAVHPDHPWLKLLG